MDETGTITSLRTGVLAGAAEVSSVMAVNETTGYSVIASTADFLGFNPSGYQQLFLFDAGGNAVQQITSNGDLFVTYNDADLSADDMRIVYAENGLLTADVRYVDLPSFGVDPGGLAPALIDSYAAGADLTDLVISNNGDYVAYRDSFSSGSAQLYRISTTTFDSDFKTEVGDEPFGFIGNGRIGFKKVNAIASYSYLAGAGNSQTLASGLTIDAVAFSQTSSSSSYIGGTFAIYDGTNDTIKLFQEDFGTGLQLDLNGAAAGSDYQLNAADTVSSLSLARGSSANRLDIGIVGQLSGTIGDSDTELYRLRFNVASLARPQLSASTNDPEYLLDSEITRRPDAYRVNQDLKELRKQIKNNIAVLEKAQNLVVTNMDLVRSAGAAFLQMSSQISDSDEADDVAAKVRKLILRNARGAALAQAENLEPIAVAALTLAE